MTLTQKVAGSAVFAFAIGGVLLSVPTDKVASQPGPAHLAQTSRHSCFDMNGKPFEWRSVNVPFAASCDAKLEAAK
jgi:hypothetical protein